MSRTEIPTIQALHSLNRLHAELVGKQVANQREAELLQKDLLHVEAVMKN